MYALLWRGHRTEHVLASNPCQIPAHRKTSCPLVRMCWPKSYCLTNCLGNSASPVQALALEKLLLVTSTVASQSSPPPRPALDSLPPVNENPKPPPGRRAAVLPLHTPVEPHVYACNCSSLKYLQQGIPCHECPSKVNNIVTCRDMGDWGCNTARAQSRRHRFRAQQTARMSACTCLAAASTLPVRRWAPSVPELPHSTSPTPR